MSLFKFGNFEMEIDFTDVDVAKSLEDAVEILNEEVKKLKKPATPRSLRLF